jgi:hypothetical protein
LEEVGHQGHAFEEFVLHGPFCLSLPPGFLLTCPSTMMFSALPQAHSKEVRHPCTETEGSINLFPQTFCPNNGKVANTKDVAWSPWPARERGRTGSLGWLLTPRVHPLPLPIPPLPFLKSDLGEKGNEGKTDSFPV